MTTIKLREIVIRSAASAILALAACAPASAASSENVPGFAVVELFTSEGCSSCPPADAALADLIRDAHGTPVYALAFHVDYWDSLGWGDPFAKSIFTERQQRYATFMRADSVYTPQAIVNGTSEFIGSERAKLKRAVDEALHTSVGGTLAATVFATSDVVEVKVSATNVPAGTPVHVALVEGELSSDVKRGENRGRTLTHENVVRSFETVPLDAAGSVTVKLAIDKTVHREHATIIIYAQRASDLRVIAATQRPLVP